MNLHATPPKTSTLNAIERAGDRAAEKADEVLQATSHVAVDALDKLQAAVQELRDDLRERTPGTLSRTAEQIDTLAQRAAEKALETTAAARERVAAVSESAIGHVRDEPVKSLLIAAAAGAAAATLIGYLSRSSR